jgi:hypothetical protein
MSNRINYIITDNNITVNYQGQTHIIPRTDPLADQLIQAVREDRKDEIPNLVSLSKRVEDFGQGNFVVQDGVIFIKGQQAPEVLSRKIIRFTKEGLPHEPLVLFAENLLKNPSYRAVNELFQFLEKNDHPITDNGCFIAYKKVRSDFLDGHTGTMDNSVGNIVEMPRNQVNEDSSQTCSYGLHVANWDYACNVYSAGEGAVMLEVEVNPADVVAVPSDYSQSKMRVCKYLVLGVVDKEHSEGTSLRKTSVELAKNYCGECCEMPCSCSDIDNEPCDACGEYDCNNFECEDGCVVCGELDCCGECEEDVEEICGSCGGVVRISDGQSHQGCDTKADEDRYPWEDELNEK